jgi:hypothetical protein
MFVLIFGAGAVELAFGALGLATAPTITQQLAGFMFLIGGILTIGVGELSRQAGTAVESLLRIEKRMIALDEHSTERLAPLTAVAERLNALGRG